MTVDDILRLCVCPDCRTGLKPVRDTDSSQLLLLFCNQCNLVFPVDDGIPILLNRAARNHEVESPLIDEAIARLRPTVRKTLQSGIESTQRILLTRIGKRTWEWEDEAFWSNEYGQAVSAETEKAWTLRLWEREPFVQRLIEEYGGFASRTVVDVGAGDGYTFRHLIAPHTSEETVYIAIDISSQGLKLNRKMNPHRRSLYVVSTASSVPVRRGAVDILMYWGILHHTAEGSGALSAGRELLAREGYILLFEAVDRPTVAAKLGLKTPHESEHEGRIQLPKLREAIGQDSSLNVVMQRELHSCLYSVAYRGRVGRVLGGRRMMYRLVSALDHAVIRSVGKFVGPFRPAGVLMLLRVQGHCAG
jgi:uncharacterized protein YbaR (Trm112 family)